MVCLVLRCTLLSLSPPTPGGFPVAVESWEDDVAEFCSSKDCNLGISKHPTSCSSRHAQYVDIGLDVVLKGS